jgi:hypothetical protein
MRRLRPVHGAAASTNFDSHQIEQEAPEPAINVTGVFHGHFLTYINSAG